MTTLTIMQICIVVKYVPEINDSERAMGSDALVQDRSVLQSVQCKSAHQKLFVRQLLWLQHRVSRERNEFFQRKVVVLGLRFREAPYLCLQGQQTIVPRGRTCKWKRVWSSVSTDELPSAKHRNNIFEGS